MSTGTATRQKRFGSETPRIFTPPLRELTPETSLGFSVIAFADDILEIVLLPWQKWLLVHMLELLPDGSLRFGIVVVLVARQNGKSTLSQVLALWFMMVQGWPLVLGTAQDLDVAEEVWQGAVDMLEDDPGLAPLIHAVVKTNGKKALVLKPGPVSGRTRYKVKAANRRAGRGLSGNLILLDELREHQNWLAWGAITKDLANSTPMLMADGSWSTMGELKVGDRIFAPSGNAVRVNDVHPVKKLRPMYRVITSDRREVIASESHLWTVKDTRRTYDLRAGWETLTTREILDRGLLRQGKELAFRLPTQDALQDIPERDLPIDPYLLGAWLGDGTSADGTLTVGTRDLADTVALTQVAGATVTSRIESRPGTWRIRLHVDGTPLRGILARAGVLGNKHVPADYETASHRQRLALLQGLLDTDGCVTAKASVQFTSTRERLADSVLFLARSLGWTAWKTRLQPKMGDIEGSPAWLVTFTYRDGDPLPFRLQRKADRCIATARPAKRLHVSVASIEPVRSEPSTCIAVDSDDHLFLAGRDLIPTHNTTNAQMFSLILAMSNAGDMTSVVLHHLRKMAHEALGDPDGICGEDPLVSPTGVDMGEDDDLADDFSHWEKELDSLGIFEWSSTPGCSRWDRDEWEQGNPALGYLIQEKTIVRDARTDPEWVFRTEVMCQWASGLLDGPFPPGAWEEGTVKVLDASDGSKYVPLGQRIVPGSLVMAALDTSHDRSMTRVAFAGRAPDGTPKVEIVAERYGQDWVKDWLMDPKRRDRIGAITGQTRGAPVSQLLTRLKEDESVDLTIVDWAGGDLTGAHGEAYDAVRDGRVLHNPQPTLDIAAGTAVSKRLGDGWVLDRSKSPSDISPLMAFIGALWLLNNPVVETPPPSPPPAALESMDVVGVPGDGFGSLGF